MMEIKLKELKLSNFKGLSDFSFKPEMQNATIRGQNATGKTTVADAFRWLLFDKDMADHKDFAIKTISENGRERSNIEHSVSGMINIDGDQTELKKSYKEKWTKRRGEAHKQLTGHTTEHYIDGVPIPKKDWDARLSDIIDEETFKLLTLPGYFNSLHWGKRRNIVLQVAGDVSDETIINSDAALVSLPEILGNRSLDEHRKVVTAEKKAINDRLKEVPARIDELSRTLPAGKVKRSSATEAYIKHLDHKIEAAKDDRELAGYRKELAGAEAALLEAQVEQRSKDRVEDQVAENKKYAIEKTIREIKNKIDLAQTSTIKVMARKIEKNDARMSELRKEYLFMGSQKAEYDEICPVCNQSLPEDQIAEAQAKWANQVAEKLKVINGEGKALKEENESHREATKDTEEKMVTLELELEDAEAHLDLIETEEGQIPDPEIPHQIIDLQNKIDKIKGIMAVRPVTDTTELEAERREEMAKLATLDAAEATKKRIKELEKEEKALAGRFEALEGQIFLMESFTKAKVHLLTDKINAKFKLARFKLFNLLVNGAVEECCDTTFKGVPWDSVNKGAQINVGLDIIKTLSEHYNITAPTWIDNAEAVTELMEIPSQTFKLIVDPKYKQMEVTK